VVRSTGIRTNVVTLASAGALAIVASYAVVARSAAASRFLHLGVD
jgi:hypothetical protein